MYFGYTFPTRPRTVPSIEHVGKEPVMIDLVPWECMVLSRTSRSRSSSMTEADETLVLLLVHGAYILQYVGQAKDLLQRLALPLEGQ